MEKVKQFLDKVVKYPMFELGALKDKEEKAIVPILEKLYKFNGWSQDKPNTIAEFKAAYREFEVTQKVSEGFPIKKEYFTDVVEKLQTRAIECFNEVQNVMKQHQKLNEYFKGFNLKASDFKQETNKFIFDLDK